MVEEWAESELGRRRTTSRRLVGRENTEKNRRKRNLSLTSRAKDFLGFLELKRSSEKALEADSGAMVYGPCPPKEISSR